MKPRKSRLALIAVLVSAALAVSAWWSLRGPARAIESTLADAAADSSGASDPRGDELAKVAGPEGGPRSKAPQGAIQDDLSGGSETQSEGSVGISSARPQPGEEHGWIMGQILSRGGAALPEVLVSALPIQRQAGATKLWARTDGKGRYGFDVSAFPTQAYRIQVAGCSEDLALKRMIRLHRDELRAEEIRAGEHGVNFTIPIIGRMELLLTDATNSQPVLSYNLRWRHRDGSEFERYRGPPGDFGPDEDGISRLHLPLGELDLEILALGYEGRTLQCSTTMGATGPRFHLALQPMVPIRIVIEGSKPFELFQVQGLALVSEQELDELWAKPRSVADVDSALEAEFGGRRGSPISEGFERPDNGLSGFASLEMGGRLLENERRGTGVWTGFAPQGDWHLRSPLNQRLRFEPSVLHVDGAQRTYRVTLAKGPLDLPSASEVLQSSTPVPDLLKERELERIEALERHFDQ